MRTKGEGDWNSTQAKLRGESSEIPRNKSYHLHSLLHGTALCIHAWGTVTVSCPSRLKDNPKEGNLCRAEQLQEDLTGRSPFSLNLALIHTGSLYVVRFDSRRYLMETPASPPQSQQGRQKLLYKYWQFPRYLTQVCNSLKPLNKPLIPIPC